MSTWSDVVQRANTDPAFRAQLKADPTATCTQAGCEVPTGATVEVVEQSHNCMHLFLGSRTRDAVVNGLLEKADSDPAFKQRLLAQPKTELEAAIGQRLPSTARVCVHEHDPQRMRLLLAPPAGINEELSDQELELVAGGGHFKNLLLGIGDFFCRDQPIAVAVNNEGRGHDFVTVGVIETPSGTMQGGASTYM